MAGFYTKLPDQCVRLLKVERRTLQPTEQSVQFSLTTVPIQQHPRYTALSYVWGTGSASKAIYINGKEFAVRPNLWACLHYLRLYYLKGFSSWQFIWVDAICINQTDTEEKNRQVRAMDKIYANAIEVTAWLGLQQDSRYLVWREDAVTTIDVDDWNPSENISDLITRPYWSRMWIIQEVVLAQQVRFFVSGLSFDFFHLKSIVSDSTTHKSRFMERVLAYTRARDPDNLGISRPLYELLLDFGDCQCQDPRDNVFALMSLVQPLDRAMLGHFFPDYSLTHDAVVVITLHYLREHCYQNIGADSNKLFHSLGVIQSLGVRRRLIAASEQFDMIYEMNQNPKREIMEILHFPGQFDNEDIEI